MDLTGVIDNLAKISEKRIKVNEGDYVVDGLLYCRKCNTPKQCRVTTMGKTITPMCLCKCESERIKAEEEEQRKAARMFAIQKLRAVGFPEIEMQNWTFEKDDAANPRISHIVKKYALNFSLMRERSKGLLLFGTVGTGKSFYAACIANALIDNGIPCLMTNFARLVNTIQGMYEGKQEYIDSLNKFDLLIIDDLAAERDTEYVNEIVTNIIDARYRSGLPLIVTTNLTAAELKKASDVQKQRIYSRLFEMCIPLEVKGEDRRKQKLNNDYKDLESILGLPTNKTETRGLNEHNN